MSKENVASTHTKNLLADTLKELLKEKSFSKITITELVERAGINRKTFYYHFRSTGALLAWMVEKETLDVVGQLDFPADLEKGINFVMDYLEENRNMIWAINNSVGYGPVHKFLCQNIYPIVLELSKQVDFDPSWEFSERMREDACRFYTEGIAGTLQSWIENPIPRDRKEVARHMAHFTEKAILKNSGKDD